MAQGTLGKITVPTPGTPVAIAVGTVYASGVRSASIHALLIQTVPGNVGKVYVGMQGMNKTTGVGVIAYLGIPTTNFFPTFSVALTIAPNALKLTDYYVDVDTANDGVVASFLVL